MATSTGKLKKNFEIRNELKELVHKIFMIRFVDVFSPYRGKNSNINENAKVDEQKLKKAIDEFDYIRYEKSQIFKTAKYDLDIYKCFAINFALDIKQESEKTLEKIDSFHSLFEFVFHKVKYYHYKYKNDESEIASFNEKLAVLKKI